MFVLVLQSQSPASISSFLSLSYALFFHSFPLSHSTLNHSMYFCSASFFTFLPMSFAFSLSFTIITIYFSYNLSACFFFFTRLFSFDLSFARWKKGIKKDFVVAASKCNEMLSLPSMHKFVLFKLIFFSFLLDSTDFIPNRIIFCESSDNTIPVQKRRISKTQRATQLLVQVSVL